jgi:fructosamine-3-kinase
MAVAAFTDRENLPRFTIFNFSIVSAARSGEHLVRSMPSQDGDISWQLLRRIVQDWAGTTAELAEVIPLDGGCISTTLKLELADQNQAVLKISPHRVDRSYEEESYQLDLLRQMGLPTPHVYAQHTGTLDEPFSYILLEFVEGVDLGMARRKCDAAEFDRLQEELGVLIAHLHEQTSQSYSRLTPHAPAQFDKWSTFFRDVFDPVWREAEQCGLLSVKQRKLVGKIHDRLDQLLVHGDQPRLVHWDIWSSNVLAEPDASGAWHVAAILDPCCKFAHAEVELAYVDLFKTGTSAFFKAYQRTHRLTDSYHRLRKPIYQLYFLLNHLQLFGAEYLTRTTAAIDSVAAII